MPNWNDPIVVAPNFKAQHEVAVDPSALELVIAALLVLLMVRGAQM
jgi:hypothetical protein